MTPMTRVLIVSPAYNEAAELPQFIARFLETRQELSSYADLRLLVVDDGSVDGTLEVLRAAAAAHAGIVGYLSFAANAGHQAALVAGFCHADTWPDVIVTMDADLEHPFEVLPQLVESWRKTRAVVVHAVRRPSSLLPWYKRLPSRMFYQLTSALTGLSLVSGQADFKLWDARTVRGVSDYLMHIGSLRVFAAWLPGVKASVDYDQVVRIDRQTRFTFRKNYELAAISIIRFSNVPLKAITVLGIIGLLFSVTYGGFVAMATLRGETVPGWSSTVLVVMTMGCLQLVSIGIVASYLRRLVFARDLPLFIVRESRLHE